MRALEQFLLEIRNLDLLNFEQNFRKLYAQLEAMLIITAAVRDTGQTWIDGKTVYEKIITVSALPNATSGTITHGISSFSRILKVEIIAKDSTDSVVLCGDGTKNLYVDSTNINVTLTFNGTAYAGFARVQYTV